MKIATPKTWFSAYSRRLHWSARLVYGDEYWITLNVTRH